MYVCSYLHCYECMCVCVCACQLNTRRRADDKTMPGVMLSAGVLGTKLKSASRLVSFVCFICYHIMSFDYLYCCFIILLLFYCFFFVLVCDCLHCCYANTVAYTCRNTMVILVIGNRGHASKTSAERNKKS